MNPGGPSPATWRQRIYQALVLVLLVALGARVAADLLEPLIPALVVLVALIAVFWFVIGRRR